MKTLLRKIVFWILDIKEIEIDYENASGEARINKFMLTKESYLKMLDMENEIEEIKKCKTLFATGTL